MTFRGMIFMQPQTGKIDQDPVLILGKRLAYRLGARLEQALQILL
jgi:hypothetical protein